MSTPNGQGPVVKPLFDPTNQFQGELPLEWTTGTMPLDIGQRAVVCLRTPNSTQSYLLAKDDLGRFITDLQKLHATMNGLILPPSGF